MENISVWENKKYKLNYNKKKSNIFVNMQNGSDLWTTPKYAVEILIPYIKKYKNSIIWCPFDTEKSQFVKILSENNFNVIFSHLELKQDFFKFEPKKWDILISNPPWSIKDKVLKRCFELNKPFGLLLPIHSLSGKYRWSLFRKNKLQLLMSKERICFNHILGSIHNRPPFESAYFCWKLLSKRLNWEK